MTLCADDMTETYLLGFRVGIIASGGGEYGCSLDGLAEAAVLPLSPMHVTSSPCATTSYHRPGTADWER